MDENKGLRVVEFVSSHDRTNNQPSYICIDGF